MFSADDLETFRQVARFNSLTKAARHLGVDQTTVGRHITNLEKLAGGRLFLRNRSGWMLTELGIRLLGHAESVHSAVAIAQEEFFAANNALAGSIRVMSPEGFASHLLLPGLAGLRARYPELAVEAVVSNRHAALGTREFDVAISIERPKTRAVTVQKLADFELRLYASTEYLATSAPIRTIADLYDHPIIWYVEEALSADTFNVIFDAIPDARPLIQSNSLTGQIAAAHAGLGVAFLPTWVADASPGLQCLEHLSESADRSYWLVVPTALQRLARVQAMTRLIHDLVTSCPGLNPVR